MNGSYIYVANAYMYQLVPNLIIHIFIIALYRKHVYMYVYVRPHTIYMHKQMIS